MAGLLAVLLFPLRPGAATRALRSGRVAALVPLAPAVALFAYLHRKGCALEDAAVASGALGLVVVAMGALGALAAAPAGLVLGNTERTSARFLARLTPCLVAAAWAPVVFLVFLFAARWLGSGATAALVAGLAALGWGVVAGVSLVGEGPHRDGGRAIVASCIGLAGALAGAWIGLLAAREAVLVVPSPVAAESFHPGDLLLVRRGPVPEPGGLVLLRRPGTAEAVVARLENDGTARPLGDLRLPPEEFRNWDIAGRLFFKFGGGGGATVGKSGQTP